MYRSMKSLVYMYIATWVIIAFLAFNLIKLIIATVIYIMYLRHIREKQAEQEAKKKEETEKAALKQDAIDPLLEDELTAYNEYMTILDWEIQNRKDVGSGRNLSDKQVARRKLEYARKARKGITL